jgi:glyoxylate reductase
MSRVLVTRRLPGPALDRLRAAHDVDVWEGDLPPGRATLLELVAGADGLLCLLTEQVDAELLDAAPGLKVVANYAVGTDNVDLEAAAARGIPVGVTPGVLTDATADLAFGLLLAAARRLVAGFDDVRAGRWRTWEPEGWLGHDVHGATARARRRGADRRGGRRAGARVRHGGRDGRGRGDDLHAALRRADFVSLHVPLSPQTRHLIDADALAQLKPTAVLVNTARGPRGRPGRAGRGAPRRTPRRAALDVHGPPEPLPARPPAPARPEPARGPPRRLGDHTTARAHDRDGGWTTSWPGWPASRSHTRPSPGH